MKSYETRLMVRFWRKVIKVETGCWLWAGARNSAGYAQIKVHGTAQYAHRVSWEARYGPIPDGLHIDHLCRVRHCVNPDHLEPVTPKENSQRGYWHTKPLCPQGHPYSGANLFYNPRGHRLCRECSRQHARRQYARQTK